jgi:hypothetical protein
MNKWRRETNLALEREGNFEIGRILRLRPTGLALRVLHLKSEIRNFRLRIWKRDFLSAAPAQAVCVKVARNQRLPCRVRPLLRLPALSLLPGQTVAQDARW